MADQSLNEAKIIFMFYNEWKRKTDPLIAAKKICSVFGKNTTDSTEVKFYYKQFDIGGTDLFTQDSSLCLSFNWNQKPLQIFIDSIFQVSRNYFFDREVYTTDGRYFITTSIYCDNIIVHDLLLGSKNKIEIETMLSKGVKSFQIVGDYLLVIENDYTVKLLTIWVLKINYMKLSVEAWKTFKIGGDFFVNKILADQLSSQKFMLFDSEEIMVGQILNDEIVMGNVKNLNDIRMHGNRFVGKKLQGFDFETRNDFGSIKLCEIDLETMEKKETNVPMKVDKNELNDVLVFLQKSCWSNERFYAFHQVTDFQYKLFAFDPQTLNWIGVKIKANEMGNIFVDKNEVMTCCIKNDQNKTCASYRISLRTPDKLMNLTWLAALREENVYENDKYIKVIRKLPIKLKLY